MVTMQVGIRPISITGTPIDAGLWCNNTPKSVFYGLVAQLVEHLPCKQGVVGSNPTVVHNTDGYYGYKDVIICIDITSVIKSS